MQILWVNNMIETNTFHTKMMYTEARIASDVLEYIPFADRNYYL